MTVTIELAYLLKKVKSSDRFDSELLLRIPILNGIEFLPPNQMEDLINPALTPEALMPVMGIRQDSSSHSTFIRHAQVASFQFPLASEIKKLRFRILTSVEIWGQDKEVAVSYLMPKSKCKEVESGALLGENWVVLVTCEGGEFHLILQKRDSGAGGGGNPCMEMNCADTPDVRKKILCMLAECRM